MADKYLVLARKWRPQRFEDVVGQEHITRTLKNAISSGRIHHAFLFIGSRGIGKTTTARILAKALNCSNSPEPTTEPCGVCSNCISISSGTNIDVIEIDGASNNGVDDVREIRDNIRMMPSSGRYKVYIIDEVHQLSISAFNALLKTLEEPPPHAVFVLATTEAHKIPATIISRCQRYDFRRVSIEGIIALLREILEKEGIAATDEALHAVARSAEGGVRDAESILDELITYCENGRITYQDVFDVLGLVDWKVLHRLCEAILDKDISIQLRVIEEVVSAGKDLGQFVQDILRYFRNLLVAKSAGTADLLHLPEDEQREVMQRAQQFSLTQLIKLVEQFAELTNSFDSQLAQRIALEALLIRLSKVGVDLSIDTVLEKILQMGGGGMRGAGSPPPSPPLDAPAPAREGARRNPTEAGPAPEAPPVPATERSIQANPQNMSRVWQRVTELAGHDSLNNSVWMSQAQPAGISGSTLKLSLDARQDQAWQYLQQADVRAQIEHALQKITSNLLGFEIQRENLEAEAAGLEKAAPAGAAQAYPGVAQEDLQAALEDPLVAHVMDVFRGKLARVEKST